MEKIIKKFGELADIESGISGYVITYHGNKFSLTKDNNGIIFSKLDNESTYDFPEVSLHIDDIQIYNDKIICIKNNDSICTIWT